MSGQTLGEAVADICDSLNAIREEFPPAVRWLLPTAPNADDLRGELAEYGLGRLATKEDE